MARFNVLIVIETANFVKFFLGLCWPRQFTANYRRIFHKNHFSFGNHLSIRAKIRYSQNMTRRFDILIVESQSFFEI